MWGMSGSTRNLIIFDDLIFKVIYPNPNCNGGLYIYLSDLACLWIGQRLYPHVFINNIYCIIRLTIKDNLYIQTLFLVPSICRMIKRFELKAFSTQNFVASKNYFCFKVGTLNIIWQKDWDLLHLLSKNPSIFVTGIVSSLHCSAASLLGNSWRAQLLHA